MNALPTIDMAEVTRLTRAGRLAEATALLRGRVAPVALRTDAAPPAAASILEMERAPGSGTWTARGVPQPLDAAPGRSGPKGPATGPARGPARGPAKGPSFAQKTFANAAGSRAYKLYVPSGYDGRPAALLVMLHGCSQSPDDFAAGTRMNALAEEQTVLVAYPAQSQAANPSRCWNWFNAAEQERDRGEPSLIAGITQEIMRDFAVDPGRVFIAGLSAGGAAAATMGCLYPEIYAAVCVHSGLACGAAKDMMSAFGAMQNGAATTQNGASRSIVPTIVFHGDRDTTVSAINGDQVIAQATSGARLTAQVSHGKAPSGAPFTRTVLADSSGDGLLEHWVLHGAGHAWAGGSAAGSFTDPRGIDASREMLRFFQAHARR